MAKTQEDFKTKRKTFAAVKISTLASFNRIRGWMAALSGKKITDSEAFEAIVDFYFNENLRKASGKLPQP